jgi:hypothetical protein
LISETGHLVLVDTSVWVDHLRAPNQSLMELLQEERVRMHPFVAGELACGNLANRAELIYLFRLMPQAAMATNDEVLFFIDKHGLTAKGVGYLDMHLLASAALGALKIWTRDRRLNEVAEQLGLSA